MATTHSPRFINSTVNYHLPSSHEEREILYPGTAGYYRRRWDTRPVRIRDMRTSNERFSLDKQGFEVVAHRSSETEYLDEDRIKSVVYPEAIEILKKATAATTIVPISHLIRRQSHASVQLSTRSLPASAPISTPTTARYVHIDQTPLGARQVLLSTFPSHPPPDSTTRWGIINVWRVIGRPVEREPIALCDARTMAEDDLRPAWLEFPRKEDSNAAYKVSAGEGFEIGLVARNEAHEWWFAEGLTPEEVMLIKIYDSGAGKGGVEARGTPHSAFEMEGDETRPTRESVEVRCLVFWDEEGD